MTNPIPPGYRTVQPYLYIDGTADAIDVEDVSPEEMERRAAEMMAQEG